MELTYNKVRVRRIELDLAILFELGNNSTYAFICTLGIIVQ